MKELPSPAFPISQIALPQGSLHQSLQNQNTASNSKNSTSSVEVSWAKHQDEVREAQRLRYDVFVKEMGARLPQTMAGHDIDLFDDYCEHLLVRDGHSGTVIGTYRVLTPAQAKRVGGTYTDTEFDLTRLRFMRERMVSWAEVVCTPSTAMVVLFWPFGGPCLNLWHAISWTP